MTSKDVRKVLSGIRGLIQEAPLGPVFTGDSRVRFVSEDERYRLDVSWMDENYKITRLDENRMTWVDADVTLEDLDQQGIRWEFTRKVLDRLADAILDIRDELQDYECRIRAFTHMVDKLAGEMVLGCL